MEAARDHLIRASRLGPTGYSASSSTASASAGAAAAATPY